MTHDQPSRWILIADATMTGFGRAHLGLCPLLTIAIGVSLLVTPIGVSSLLTVGRSVNNATAPANKTSQDPLKAMMVDPILKFGSRLLRKLDAGKHNVVFSPLVIHSALNLALLGAKSGSETEMELLKVLGYTECELKDNKAQEAYGHMFDELNIRDKSGKRQKVAAISREETNFNIWSAVVANSDLGRPFPNYLDSISKYHRSSVKSFGKESQVINETNNWTKEAEFKGTLIEPTEIKEEFNLMLLNAANLNFNLSRGDLGIGLWKTGKGVAYVRFATSGNVINKKKVISDDDFKLLAKLNFHSIDIPLNNSLSLSLACFMPSNKSALAELEKQLLRIDDDGMLNLCRAFKVLDKSKVSTEKFYSFVSVPNIYINFNINLKVALKSMGLKRIFDERNNELTKMFKKSSRFDIIKHQAEIRKYGSSVWSLKNDIETSFNLNQPFLFVVRYKRIPIMMGHMVKDFSFEGSLYQSLGARLS